MLVRKNLTEHISSFLIPVLGVLLFAYVIARANCVAFTCDEAVSFLRFAIRTWDKIFTIKDANNHLLNTILMRATSDHFGNSEFLLRLPNVIGGGFFILFSALLVRRLSVPDLLKPLLFLFLNCNMIVFEFFSLARGYGIASGLLMVSIYHVYRMIETRKIILHSFIALVTMMLAVLASFMVTNFAAFVLVAVPVIALLLTPWKEKDIKQKAGIIFWSLLLLCTGILFLWRISILGQQLKAAGELYYGTSSALMSLNSIAAEVMYGAENILTGITDRFALVSVCLFVLVCVLVLFRVKMIRQSHETAFAAFMTLGLGASLCAHFVQTNCMDMLYPQYRTGGYIMLLWTVVLVMGVTILPLKIRKVGTILFFCYAFATVSAFLLAINFSRAHEWESAESIDEAMSTVIADAESRPGSNIYTVSCSFELVPVVNYYIYTSGTKRLNYLDDSEGNRQPGRDYYFSSVSDTAMDSAFPVLYAGSSLRVAVTPGAAYQWITEVHEDFEQPGGLQGEGKTGKFSGMVTDSVTRSLTCTVTDALSSEMRYRITAWAKPENFRNQNRLNLAVIRGETVMVWRTVDLRWSTRSQGWNRVDFVFMPSIDLLPGDKFYMSAESIEPFLLIDDVSVMRAVY